MTTGKFIAALVCAMLITGVATAQDWSKEQSAVWQVVIDSYKDIDARDANWSKKWVFADAMVWGSYPMPRNRDSIQRWDKYNFSGGRNHVSEYSPTAIVVHGSTAVAHYYYSNATEDRKGEHETSHGKCTDILAKDGKSWKFIAWHCADAPGDD
ncbi:MAG: DUF4440 domain-containing protein [Gammaproteobacteria bacterium]|nr:DUF4440 domain-containing protein [Gammaproteobacteria bacterium]NNF60629.1 DUF4440 domain-containing protein [Gammaproteobacteria bacterium]